MMRRLLLMGHLDGQTEALVKLQTLVKERGAHGVLFAGGIGGTNAGSHAARLKEWEACLHGLGNLGVFTAVIPGPADVPPREFLRLAKNAEVDNPNLHIAHATVWEQNDVAISGLGGELTEAEDCAEDRLCSARGSAEYFLRSLWQADPPRKVLLLSVAPPGPLGGEAGNRICGDFIDSYHPSLCVVAGTTERRGTQQIAHTLVVNPGRLADGSVAWLDWNRNRGEQVEFLKI
jgi:Icc-related predicted phosphoesterase